MKAKLNFKSKRTIIVISIIAVLAIAAGVSAYFFTKGNDTAGATNAGQEEQASNNGVAITENNNGQNGQNNAPESNSNQPNSQDSTLNANQNDGTQNNDGVNNGTTGETGNNQGVANANQGTTGTNTGATTQPRRTNNNANRTTTNIPGTNTDATTTYEQVEENIVVENPWESHMVEWTPENVKTAVVSAKEVTGRDINIEKTAETSTGKTAVSAGDEITYKIKITNNEEKVLNSLYIKDSIPEGTEFVSIDELGIVDEEKTQVSWNLWDLGLKKGESKEVSFKVKVTEKAKEIKTIKNIAYAENTPSDEDKPTKNPVLESSKSHEIVRNNEVMPSKENVPAKVGDKIEYTITVKNLGEVEGITSIKDSDLAAILENEKATLEGNIILKNGNGNGTKIEKDDLINGFDITVKANETATVKFSLVVNKVDGKIKNVATIGGSKEDEDIVETIDWAIEKSSKLEEKNGTIGDGKAEKGDIIHYTIKITNKGSKKIENLIVEDELLGWIGDTAKKVTIEYNGIETIEGSYEVKQEDIDAQKPVKNMVVGIYDNEEKTSETENPVVDKTEGVKVTKTSNLVKAEGNKVEGKAEVNDTINYAVIVKNTGNVTLKEVTINDEKLNIKDRKESGTLAPGAETTIQLGSYTVTQADVDKQEKIYNTVTVNGTDGTDPGTDVVEKTEAVKVTKTSSLEKATGNTVEGKAEVNDTVDYAVIVKNTGNVTLTEVTINDDKLGIKDRKESVTLAPGAETTIQLGSYTVTQADVDAQEKIYNTVTVNGTKGTDPGTDVVKATPAINIIKKVAAVKDAESEEFVTVEENTTVNVKEGDTVKYKLTVENTENVTLTNVVVTDTLVPDFKEEIDELTPREKRDYYVEYVVKADDVANVETNPTLVNTANVVAKYKEDEVKDNSSATVDITAKPDLSIEKTQSLVKAKGNTSSKAEIGDTINYKIIVRNTGNKKLTSVHIVDSKVGIDETIELEVGAYKEYDKPYTVGLADLRAEGKILNTATAKDEETDEKQATVETEKEELKPELSYKKSSSANGKVAPGEEIEYTITVENTGYANVTNVEVTDKVPEGTTLVEIENEGTQLDDGTIKWVISTINAENGKATVKFKVKVDLDLNDGDKVLNNMAKVNENPTNPTTDVVKNVDRKIKAVINSPSIRKTNIVLVLDLSSSMTANRSTRLADAKVATVDFIKNIYKDSTVSGVNIKVVTFNTKDPKYYYDGWQGKYVKVSYSGTDVLEVSGLQDNTATNYNQAQTLINAINAIEIPNDYKEGGFGTHIYSALQKTNKEITSLKDKYTDNDNVVVFIGDGAPTQNDRNNFYGDQYNDNTNYNIESEAKEIKKVATVYAIRLGDEAQGTTILKTIATEEGKVFDAENKADLINNFSAINADSSSKDKNFQSSNGYVTIDDVDLNVSTEVDEKTGKKKTFKVFVDGNKIAEFNSIEELNNSGYITYNATSKKIEWNVREYSKNANLSLEYWVN